MNRPTCLCGEVMTHLMDNEKHTILECSNCGRLLLVPKHADWQRWFIPELDSRELPKESS